MSSFEALCWNVRVWDGNSCVVWYQKTGHLNLLRRAGLFAATAWLLPPPVTTRRQCAACCRESQPDPAAPRGVRDEGPSVELGWTCWLPDTADEEVDLSSSSELQELAYITFLSFYNNAKALGEQFC